MAREIAKLFAIACFLMLSIDVAAQSAGEKYFLRHSMIFFQDEPPFVSASEIQFTKLSFCGFSSAPYQRPILQRGAGIQLVSIDRSKNPALLTISDGKVEFVVQVQNGSKSSFRRSFNLAFTKGKRDFGWGGAKSWDLVIRKFGFPIARCERDGGWFYILEFSPNACGSFDGCVLTMTKKGISVYGYN